MEDLVISFLKSGVPGVRFIEKKKRWISDYCVLGADGRIRWSRKFFMNKADAVACRHAFNVASGYKVRT